MGHLIKFVRNKSVRNKISSCLSASVLVLILGLFLWSCTDPTVTPTTDSSSTSGTFTNIYTTTLKKACIQCHVPDGDSGSAFDVTTQDLAYKTLTQSKVLGKSSVGICGSANLIVPGDVSKSYFAAVLMAKYNATNFAGITGCLPYSAHLQDQNLSDAEQTSIVKWITDGAKNN